MSVAPFNSVWIADSACRRGYVTFQAAFGVASNSKSELRRRETY